MTKRLINPELDELVRQMNRVDGHDGVVEGEDPSARGLDPPSIRDVQGDEPLERLLVEMVQRKASDLLLIPGAPPVLRINGELAATAEPAVDGEAVRMLLAPHLGARSNRLLAETGSTDIPLRLAGSSGGAWRLRVNVQRQRGELAAAIRALPQRIPTLEELRLPADLADLVSTDQGLVLVCGPTGCGKSTTLAALLDVINRNRARHVITIEDPIEYEHANRRSVFEQVEIGRDAPSFGLALRAALRRDPDVLLVGEMRDRETISTVVTAAETGHLILSTLHTGTATQAIHRIVDVFPGDQQQQIRFQLALSLRAVVCQQLVPTADGRTRVPGLEVLVATPAVRNLIRHGRIEQLYNELAVGSGHGMRTMERSLATLVKDGVISREEALERAFLPQEFERALNL